MKIVVNDANALLDLVNGEILGLWLGLGYVHYTTTLVWAEVSRTNQRAMVQPFIDSGLIQLRDVEHDSWQEVYDFSKEACVSISDSSVFLLARAERAILLTGDSKLRRSSRLVALKLEAFFGFSINWLRKIGLTRGRRPRHFR